MMGGACCGAVRGADDRRLARCSCRGGVVPSDFHGYAGFRLFSLLRPPEMLVSEMLNF